LQSLVLHEEHHPGRAAAQYHLVHPGLKDVARSKALVSNKNWNRPDLVTEANVWVVPTTQVCVPSANAFSISSLGTEKLLRKPRMSVNHSLMNLMSFSSIFFHDFSKILFIYISWHCNNEAR
jgi:hypothetical protein